MKSNSLSLLLCWLILEVLAQPPQAGAQQDQHDPRHNDPAVMYGYDEEPYRLESGPHLFVDWRYVFAGRTHYYLPDGKDAPRYDLNEKLLKHITSKAGQTPGGIRLEAQQATKTAPVLSNDKPWEYIHSYLSMKYFNGKYRMWYEVVPPRADGKFHPFGFSMLCYAESDDGLHWTKPELGLVEFNGSRANNIVYGKPLCGHEFHGSSVWVDPLAPPEERLKVVYMSDKTPVEEIAQLKATHPESVSAIGEKKRLMMRLASSGDGIHWSPQPEPLMAHIGDTQTRIYYDHFTKSYVGYFRMLYMQRRAIGISGGRDLKHWPTPRLLLFPSPNHDDPGDDYYINGYTRYPGTKTMHLMMVTVFKRYNDSLQASLAASLDGRAWTWIPGGPVLKPGKLGEWDGGCLFVGTELTQLPDGRVAMPYWGYVYPHKHPRYERHMGAIALATWPKERLAALVADQDGEFFTIPLKADGQRLFLNFQTAANGYVQVGIQDKSGRSVDDCDLLDGDHLKKEVTWDGEPMGIEPGESFTLHLRLRQAKLFSFEVR